MAFQPPTGPRKLGGFLRDARGMFFTQQEVCSLLNSKGTVIICWPFGEGCADKLCKFERFWNNPQVFLFKDCSPLKMSWSLHQNWWPQLFLRSVWVPRIPGIQTLSASLWLDLDGFQNGGAAGTPGLLRGVGDTGLLIMRKIVRRSNGIPRQFCSASFQIFQRCWNIITIIYYIQNYIDRSKPVAIPGSQLVILAAISCPRSSSSGRSRLQTTAFGLWPECRVNQTLIGDATWCNYA
jgi:hypothetical protein